MKTTAFLYKFSILFLFFLSIIYPSLLFGKNHSTHKRDYKQRNIPKVSKTSKKTLKKTASSNSTSKTIKKARSYPTKKETFQKLSPQNGEYYQVKKGDTLEKIAKKFNLTVEEIKRINNLKNSKLSIGQKIMITKVKTKEISREDGEQAFITHKISPGETLYRIAKKYQVSIEELKNINNLSEKKLKIGMEIKIPIKNKNTLYSGDISNKNISQTSIPLACPVNKEDTKTYHIVKEGETLYRISLMYNVPLEELKKINNLENNIISVGQKLILPSTSLMNEKPFMLDSPKKSMEVKEENLKEKFEKNIISKNKILTPTMLSKEEEMALRQKFIELSKNLADSRYKLGGEGNGYLDCSAFVKIVYDEIGIKLPRSSVSQFQVGVPVNEDELIPGDLVFFKTTKNRVSHVGIYIGDNRFIHISSSKKRISVDSLNDPYFKSRYVGAKRVLNGEVLEYFQDYLNKNSKIRNNSKQDSQDTIPEVIF